MSHEEQGIAQAQIAADQARRARGEPLHESANSFLGERIFLYFGVIAFIGLMVVWATASSALVLYGSLFLAILLVLAWGCLRIRRINRIKQERARQAAASQAAK